MTRGARVTSIETVQDFRNKLCEFGKDAKDVLCARRMHIQRMFDWLNERGKHWNEKSSSARKRWSGRRSSWIRARPCARTAESGFSDQERALHKAKCVSGSRGQTE